VGRASKILSVGSKVFINPTFLRRNPIYKELNANLKISTPSARINAMLLKKTTLKETKAWEARLDNSQIKTVTLLEFYFSYLKVIYQAVHKLKDDFDRGKVNGNLIVYIHGLSDVRVINSIILNSNAYYH
jgi:hypothetical protein